jgi:hypothetical protein
MKATKKVGGWLLRTMLILAPAIQLAPVATAQNAKTQSAVTAKSHAAAKRSGGSREGIKVHGHWVIEVRNPDGRLAIRREFNNDLTPRGVEALVRLLGRGNSAGLWSIVFDDGPSLSSSPCGVGKSCAITEGTGATLFPSQVLVGEDTARLMRIGVPTQLELYGSGKVPANGTVGRVSTVISLCTNGLAPATPCALAMPTNAFSFTEALAPQKFAAANVVAGQIIQFTVTFTFS